MRPLAALFAIAASLLAVGLVVQVFLAGLGVFDDPTFFLTHRDTGYTLGLLALVVLVLAVIAHAGRAQVGRVALVFLLFIVQSALVGVRASAPAVAALHPLNGFLILVLSLVIARDAWRMARTRRPDTAPAVSPPVQA